MGISLERLYISTVASDAGPMALRYRLGLELAQFCTASNMDAPDFPACDRAARQQLCLAPRHIFHAPFNELCPAAVDPLARELAKKRLRQAATLAYGYDIRRMVVHSGFIPTVYDEGWFTQRSVLFWRELLGELPRDMTLLLENVMEARPALLTELAAQVDDPRLRLCLDVGHANAALSQAPATDWARAFAPWLGHVHLHDNGGGADTHAALGTGTAPLEETLDLLVADCPDATYTVESLSAAPSLTWLDRNGFLEV